jgi:AcrR family transcriptional regulator
VSNTPAKAGRKGLGNAMSCLRPRVEGAREDEILQAALEVLNEVGYDRLTMDAVAQRAHASKATLYRRWSTKAQLVIDAMLSNRSAPTQPDTGTLRGDLIAMYGASDLTEQKSTHTLGAVLTAMACDPDFSARFREQFIAPKVAVGRAIFERAQARGEIDAEVNIDLLAPAIPGIILHRHFVLGELPTLELVLQVIDQLILPAARVNLTSANVAEVTTIRGTK